MTSKKITRISIKCLLCFLMLAPSYVFSQVKYGYTNNWYVGDTEAGEWIKHKQIWLAKGNYRFTTRVVAPEEGKTLALELNNNILFSGVPVPVDKSGKFHLAHLGSASIEAGYYDVKLLFETGNVNCDMIFIKRDDRTDNTVLDTDLEYSLNPNDGMHISPITGSAGSSSAMAKAGDAMDAVDWFFRADPINGISYTREQIQKWNKQMMYTYHMEYTQEAMDIIVQEFAESKVDFIWAHGRGEPDTENQIIDRDFRVGAGSMPCRGVDLLVDAINRNPYTRDNLKVAYFFDNAAPYTSAGTTEFGYTGELDYDSDDFREFMWEFAVKKWYQTIPKDMLHTIPDKSGQNRTIVPMQWWTVGTGVEWGDKKLKIKCGNLNGGMVGFFSYLQKKMMDEFGLTPAWILADGFFNLGGDAVKYITWGVQAWFEWGKNNTEIKSFAGRKFAFALNGGRQPIYTNVKGDWNPETNTGTFLNAHKGTHMNALDANGKPTIRSVFQDGTDQKAEWLVLESWGDWFEGSTWYRSGHSEYAYPNQHLNLCREFADKETNSVLLEAEGCDEFYDKSKGNSGGAYRLDWYKNSEWSKEYWDANLEVDLDIFRPLHQMSEITPQYTKNSETYSSIEAGLRDVWAVSSNGRVFANEVDGNPLVAWRAITNSLYVDKLAMGGYNAWGISTTGEVRRSTLPNGRWSNVNNSWAIVDGAWSSVGGWLPEVKVPEFSGAPAQIEGYMTMKDIDVNNAMAWAVDSENNIYYRNFSCTRPWIKVPGKLTSIVVDELFGWGFAPDGSIMRFSLQSKSDWKTIANPYNLKKLSANCEEVWGVNDKNEVYRISSAGYGHWEKVATGFKDVSIGTNFVWFLDTEGYPHKCELSSFTNQSVFSSMDYTGIESSSTNVAKVIVYPNPFIDELSVSITSDVTEEATIMLLSIDGRTLLRKSISIPVGDSKYDLTQEILGYDQGVYLLCVDKKSGREVVKILKQ